jgi:ornithine cyclodeaminase/alanine dehydrogenase-like protein (mu-crystallin family)
MPSVRYLAAADVAAAMPSLPERLALAETTLRALGRDAELPSKIGVHPRQAGSVAHAMPALLRGSAADGSHDTIGLKWIVGFPDNPAIGLPTYHALLLLNDPRTGVPLAVMDAGTITAERTAAISGTAIRLFMPATLGRPARVAVLGAGAQARAHLPIVGHLLPGASIRLTDREIDRAHALAADAATFDGVGAVEVVPDVRRAVEGADLVVSVVSFGPDQQALDPDWLGPETLFVAVDYDMQAPASLAAEARFVVDERVQFLATRSAASFAGYPDPDATLGEVLRDRTSDGASGRPAGRILVTHLGVGLADVVFASAILGRAEQLGLGHVLPL